MSKIEFTLKQNEGEHLKSWRVTDFANKISEIHYKEELLVEVQKKLTEGIESKNIFIFDSSFSIHKTNRYIGKHSLNSETGVKNLYHLGLPISLYPNKEILAIFYIFRSFSKLYTEFNKDSIKIRLDKSNIKRFVEEARASEEELLVTKFQKYIDQCLNRVSNSEKKQELSERLKEIFSEMKKGYKNKIANQNKFVELDKKYLLLENEMTKKDKRKFKNLYKETIGKFEYYFITNKRPIIGIYDSENNKIEILCVNFIKQDGMDDKQFNLKEISHNSPYTIIFIATYVLANLFYQMYANKVDASNIEEEEEHEIESEETEQLDTINNDEVLEVLAQWDEIKTRLGIMLEEEQEEQEEQEEEQEEEESIPLEFGVTYSLQMMQNSNVGKMAKNFKVNGFKYGDLIPKRVED